jgi:acetyl-CoA/propionyl-CoA carboxylase biotin carboxyl carrier protein
VPDCVLIANRGEIAVRIARTVHAMGLRSATVFVPDDRCAVHVSVADAAYAVPSYLEVDAVLDAARRTGARFVHPGYGFLSENAGFARAVIDAGLTWVGPPPEAIERMGDKAQAKALARSAGVPVVPGVEGRDVSLEEIRGFCAEHGYPAVIKALAGGGGKGMRVVRSEDELEGALAASRREAQSGFGDDRVLVERYLERPRHIEVQILADAHGTCLAIGERECSLQRRHQKVIEEAPSPVVDDRLRARMGEAAVALARACGYVGAGTVELIATNDASEFAFLEMNTRLQVEHPVTELVYGLDLVEQQLRIARGEPLGITQEQLVPDGHAVEARLYAEDPGNGFLPATGTVRAYREPSGEGVRVDSGIREGTDVGTAFDPMLAKVIAHGRDREEALGRLDRALAELVVLGVATNAAFSRELLALPDVASGTMDTGLLERVLDERDGSIPADLFAAAAIAARHRDIAVHGMLVGPWRRDFEDLGTARASRTQLFLEDEPISFAAHEPEPGVFELELDGVVRRYAVVVDPDAVWVARDGHHLEARFARPRREDPRAPAGSLEAPMPGTVLAVNVSNGDAVDEGDVLMVIESMKMELSITAPAAGTVADLEIRSGDRVAQRQALLTVVA